MEIQVPHPHAQKIFVTIMYRSTQSTPRKRLRQSGVLANSRLNANRYTGLRASAVQSLHYTQEPGACSCPSDSLQVTHTFRLACALFAGSLRRTGRHEARALHAAVRACRRVYSEYQGQLLWKAVSPGGGRGEEVEDLTAAFEAEVRYPQYLSITALPRYLLF